MKRDLNGPSEYGVRPADIAIAGLSAAAALAVYVWTLAPTVSGEDSGELIAAAYTLGIPHPTGYPLWCLLGRLFIAAIPWGGVAWRVNLSSAVTASAAVFVCAVVVTRLTRNRLAALAAALALAFSFEFWEQSVIAEVYALNALFVVLCVWLLLEWRDSRRDSTLYCLALVYGLSLCNHSTMVLLGPVFLAFWAWVERPSWGRWRTYAIMAGLMLLGLSVYAYLPIRARANPAMNWGNPATWRGFWDVFTRRQHQFIITGSPRSVARFLGQLQVFAKILIWQFAPWVAPLGLVGLLRIWRRDLPAALLLLLLFLVVSVGAILIPNFDLDRQSIWINTTYWIPAYLIMAVFIGAGLDWAGSWFPRGLWRGVAIALGGLACVASPLALNYTACDKSEYYFARDYGVNLLRTMDQDALYFPIADHRIFPVMYLQVVEGLRPDVVIANKYGYLEPALYQDMPAEMKRGFGKYPNTRQQADIERWVTAYTWRPVYFTRKPAFGSLPGKSLVNAGLLYRVVDQGESFPRRDYWQEYAWRTLDTALTRGEMSAGLMLYDYHFARARGHLDGGDTQAALDEFEQGLLAAGQDKEWLSDVGSVCAEYRLYDVAKGYYLQALKLDPQYSVALCNLGRVYMRSEQLDLALAQFDNALHAAPDDPAPYWLAARCALQLGRDDDALTRLEALAALTPDDYGVYREIGFLYLENRKDPTRAQTWFARSLALNEDQPDLAQLGRAPSRAGE